MRRRAFAWANLAYRFGLHVARMPLRPLRRRREADRFLEAVRPEGYEPLEAGERDDYPAFMDCVQCGLCSMACPVLREAPASAWQEALTFIAGPSRSIDRADLAAASVPPCTRCGECEQVCPMDVPVPRLAALVERMGRPDDRDGPAGAA